MAPQLLGSPVFMCTPFNATTKFGMVDLWEGRFQEVRRAIVFAQSASRGLSATAASCS